VRRVEHESDHRDQAFERHQFAAANRQVHMKIRILAILYISSLLASCGSVGFITISGTAALNQVVESGKRQQEYYVVAHIKNRGVSTYDDIVGAFTPYNAQPLEEVHSETHNGEPEPALGAWASKEEVFRTDGYTEDLVSHSSNKPITFSITLRRHGVPAATYAAVLPTLSNLPHPDEGERGAARATVLEFSRQDVVDKK
jgi:hypothetical protein